jgi:hypothetical protein
MHGFGNIYGFRLPVRLLNYLGLAPADVAHIPGEALQWAVAAEALRGGGVCVGRTEACQHYGGSMH